MTDQPERVVGTGAGAPAPDVPTPTSQPAPTPPPQPAPVQPAAPAWGAQPAPAPAAQPAPAPAPQPAAPAWGAQPAPTPAPQPAPAPATWGTPPAGAWGAQPPAGGPPPGWAPAGPPPAPRPPRPRGSSGRISLTVLGVILGVLFGANIINAALPLPEDPTAVDPGPALPQDPGNPEPTATPEATQDPGNPTETAIPIRTQSPLGTPAPIETAAPIDPGPVNPGAGVDVGAGFMIYPPDGWSTVGSQSGLTVFQKGGALLIVGGLPWTGSPTDLATQYRDAWFAGGKFTGDDPQSGSMGNGIPAAGLNYTGVLDGTQIDGAIITGATNGSGILFNFFGAQGSLNGVSADLDAILRTVQHTGG